MLLRQVDDCESNELLVWGLEKPLVPLQLFPKLLDAVVWNILPMIVFLICGTPLIIFFCFDLLSAFFVGCLSGACFTIHLVGFWEVIWKPNLSAVCLIVGNSLVFVFKAFIYILGLDEFRPHIS